MSSMWQQFHDDPFFGRMPNMMDSFGRFDDFFGPSSLALGYGDEGQRSRNSAGREVATRNMRTDRRAPDDMMLLNPFESMNSIMSNMNNVFAKMRTQMHADCRGLQSKDDGRFIADPCHYIVEVPAAKGCRKERGEMPDGNGAIYCQSSVMSYSNLDGKQPMIYQATTATKQAPGGVRETYKSLRDSEAGIEKMAHGRHINDRGHVITKQRDRRTGGQIEEHQDYLNIDEEEAPRFNEEWQETTRSYSRHGAVGYRDENDYYRTATGNGAGRHRGDALAIEAHPTHDYRRSSHDEYEPHDYVRGRDDTRDYEHARNYEPTRDYDHGRYVENEKKSSKSKTRKQK